MTDLSGDKEAQAARAELQKAQALLEIDPVAARRHLAEARHLDPRNPELALGLARLEVRLGLYQEALESLCRLLMLDDSSDEALALSAFCCLRLGSLEQAEDLAKGALGRHSGNRVALEVRADCLKAAERWQEASLEYQALLAMRGVWGEPARARLSLKLGRCLLQQGAPAAAWEIAEVLFRRGYRGPQLRSLRRECERMNRRELSRVFGGGGFWERAQLWFAQGQIARALSLGSRRHAVSGSGPHAEVAGLADGLDGIPSAPEPLVPSATEKGAG